MNNDLFKVIQEIKKYIYVIHWKNIFASKNKKISISTQCIHPFK